ncbi:hypothetical protein LTR36_005202 [Oleoguttula mirabilis]|uniref:GRIP domain-containing protein n=1 Tax=Oleoguttula mirabilis TaxID=1507867 RepID=A0AAV9JWC5_9PEZI|nr:hypothetical protein LTR36_005202 [Oleoguttula mirabilis]
MSTMNASDPTSKSASKRKGKKSKKKANGKVQANADTAVLNGTKHEGEPDLDEEDEEDEGIVPSYGQKEDGPFMPSSPPRSISPAISDEPPRQDLPRTDAAIGNSVHHGDDANGAQEPVPESSAPSSDTTERLDAMQLERDNLRNEVTQLRQSLEGLQQQHSEEVSSVQEELEQTQQGKEHAEIQYRNLLGKVNTIRSQLGERLKQDAEELEQARGRIEELESEKATTQEDNQRLQEDNERFQENNERFQEDGQRLQEDNQHLQKDVATLNRRMEEQASEVESLRSRTNLSTSNWVKERDDLISREAYIREEYQVARQAMQDWEILATEERLRREALEERIVDLEEQLGGAREAYERVRGEAETQGSTVDGLQRALQQLQAERKRELRELVEQSQSQLDELRKHAKLAEESASELKQQLETTKKELDRALPFEREVKEKNLLIGKLRHEAVILNDHLTKALRFLKRGKPEDNVDRQLVTNHFLHFLALDRSDAKKFQILQLIAALLGWNEQQKEQAGLVRAGSGMSSLKLPVSPFRRTPSTPSLSSDFVPESPGGASRESLAELWSEFLEREAEAGGGGSRRGSVAQSIRSPSMTSQSGVISPVAGRQSPEIRRTDSSGAGSSKAGQPK